MSSTALSWAVSVGGAAAGALAFLAATLLTGDDYDWVARLGGATWVFLLALIILLPTVMPFLRERR